MAEQKQKLYRIGKIAEKLQINPSVLRFWEKEFPEIIPLRTEKGQRVYTEEKAQLIERIYTLLYVNGMTIPGARRVLAEAPLSSKEIDFSDYLLQELHSLRQLLSKPLI